MNDTIAPPDQLAAFTRKAVTDLHIEWDGPHQFAILINVEGHVQARLLGILTSDIPPDKYPQIMAGLAAQDIASMEPGDPYPVAYLLQYEAFGYWTQDRAAMAPQEQADFDADVRDRKLHERADSEETCRAICADVTGRIYKASKLRLDESVRDEQFQFTGHSHGALDDGVFTSALAAIALSTGMAFHKLPGPPSMYN